MLARLAFFLLLITPPIALAADAPPGGGKITVAPQPPKAAAAAPARTPVALPPAALASAAPADGSSCRMDCAQSYYFCRAGENPDDCSPGWTQCVTGCTSPNLAPPTPTAP
jgi:hypothetical protein